MALNIEPRTPPRLFSGGWRTSKIVLRDCGTIRLEPDEQVTFVTDTGSEYDVARKSWGFYATPSLNARLPEHGLRGVLVMNRIGRVFLLLVERGHENEFEAYVSAEEQRVITWLDTDDAVAALVRHLT